MLDKILILKPILDKIADGHLFSTLFFWFLRITAGFVVLAALAISWNMWSAVPKGTPFKMFIALAVLEVFLLAIGYFVINILLLRAGDIQALPHVKSYSITPICVILIKMMGEICGTVYAALGLAMGLAIFVGGDAVSGMLSMLRLPGMGLLGGSALFAIIGGAGMGIVTLFAFYFGAEQIGALVDVARNTAKTR